MKKILLLTFIVIIIISCNNDKEKLEEQVNDSLQKIERLEIELETVSKELEKARKEANVQVERYLQIKSECK